MRQVELYEVSKTEHTMCDDRITMHSAQPVTDIPPLTETQYAAYARIGEALAVQQLVTESNPRVRYGCPLCDDPLHRLSQCPRWRVKGQA